MKKLYYNAMEREFYFVTKRPKTILMKWAVCRIPISFSSDGRVVAYSIMSYNVKWTNDFINGNGLVVNIDGSDKKHCLKEYSDNYILIYPYQEGQPFALELATVKNIEDNKSYDYSQDINNYYDNLLEFIGG